jgi:RNA-directed DNA polymerase
MEQGEASAVPETAMQETEAPSREWWWMEASIWTARMASALVNGVRGGKWFSLAYRRRVAAG